MLQRNIEHHPAVYRDPAPAYAGAHAQPGFESELLAGALRSLRRHARLVLACVLIGTTVTTVGVLMVAPQFKASVVFFVDPRRTQLLKDRDVVGLPGPGTDSGVVESEAEVMKSPALMLRVARQLDLANDEEFTSRSLLGTFKAVLLWPLRMLSGSTGDTDPLSAIAEKLSGQVEAKRRNLTYLIELNAWSRNPGKALKLADTIAEHYLARQMEAKSAVAQRATHWLNQQVAELRDRVQASERAYEQYKAESGLFSTRGENLSDHQVAQLNEQLVNARARAAEARAKLDQLKQITPDKLQTAAASPEVLQSTVVSQLRGQYAETARRHAELVTRYGARHPQVEIVRAQLSDIAGQVTAEIGRIVASARAEYQTAASREVSLEASLNGLKTDAARSNQSAVRLRELEREAQANRELFQAFLARAKETTAQIDLQLPDARIVSAASVPTAPGYPRRTLIVGLGFFVSLGLGVVLALARDVFGTGFRKAEELEIAFGLPPLTSIPLVEGPRRWPSLRGPPLLGDPRSLHRVDATAAQRDAWSEEGGRARRLASLALDYPDSPFAESIRSLRFSLNHAAAERDIVTVLVASALPGEGKSTVAANLARVAAAAGERVLLIDGDLRGPTLAEAFASGGSAGLAGLLAGASDLKGSMHRDARTGLYLIAGTTRRSGAEALELLSSERMGGILALARTNFDLVILDTSPLTTVIDSRVLIDQVDGVVLVVASQQTSRDAVAAALRESPGIEEKIVGVVLNKAAEEFDRRYHNAAPPAAAA
jgi:succinoglycan biosynthesis transport protein ExoP